MRPSTFKADLFTGTVVVPRALLVFEFLALGACVAMDDHATAGITTPQSAEVAVLLASQSGGPGLGELASHRLTPELLSSYALASGHLLVLERQGSPALERVEDAVCELWATDIPGIVAGFDSEVEVRRALRKAGISTREFVLTQAALLFAVEAHQAAKAGKVLPLAAQLPAENIAFVDRKWPEIERILRQRSVR